MLLLRSPRKFDTYDPMQVQVDMAQALDTTQEPEMAGHIQRQIIQVGGR